MRHSSRKLSLQLKRVCARALVMMHHAAGGDAAEEERVGKVHTGVFSKDLPWLMYGFGDADKPLKVGEGGKATMAQGGVHKLLLLDMCGPLDCTSADCKQCC